MTRFVLSRAHAALLVLVAGIVAHVQRRAPSQAMLLRESMGVGADSTNKAFAQADVSALMQRPTKAIERDFYEMNDRDNTNHVIIAVDPAGGGASAFAVASIVQLPNGSLQVYFSLSLSHPGPAPGTAPPPIAEHFAGPHLGEHSGQRDKGIWSLTRIFQERWNDQR
jgi:hypothetical protein